jgi:hypothetical protein
VIGRFEILKSESYIHINSPVVRCWQCKGVRICFYALTMTECSALFCIWRQSSLRY